MEVRPKRIKRWLVFALARCAATALLLCPMAVALFVGRVLGRVAYVLDRPGRTQALDNLRAVWPDRAAEIAKQAYANAGMIAVELALLPRIRRMFRRYVELPEADLTVLREAYAEGRGVVFVTGHVGNWELLAQRVLIDDFDGVTVARKAPNPYLGDWLVRQRAAGGLESILRGEPKAARKILGALKRGALLGVLVDQDTKVKSVHVPFFGRLASTPVAAAELALKRKAPVVMGFIHRKSGSHRVTLERLDITGLDAKQATARFTERIEAEVRSSPGEWVWFHARWKTPPPG